MALAKQLKSSQSRIAKMEAGDPAVSLDLRMRAHLALGAKRAEIGRFVTQGVVAALQRTTCKLRSATRTMIAGSGQRSDSLARLLGGPWLYQGVAVGSEAGPTYGVMMPDACDQTIFHSPPCRS